MPIYRVKSLKHLGAVLDARRRQWQDVAVSSSPTEEKVHARHLWTVRGLAKQAGLGHTVVGRMLQGQRFPTWAVLQKVLDVLELDLQLGPGAGALDMPVMLKSKKK